MQDERVSEGGGLFESSEAGGSESATGGQLHSPEGLAPTFDLNGYVRSDVFVGEAPDVSRGTVKAAYGELALKLKVRKQNNGDAYAEARLRYGELGGARETHLTLREAFVNLYAGPLDLRLGQQIIVWGRADVFNPTNNLTPVDLRARSPIEDDRRLGNVGARAFLTFPPFRLEGVWMPLYSPTELPTVALPSAVTFGEPNFPSPKLENGLVAGRIHLELPAFEASASYLYGYSPLPGLALRDFSGGENYGVRIARTPYEQHVVGCDFSTVIADWLGLRGEAAYRMPVKWRDNVYSARPDVQYVFGVDHTFGSLSVIAQYIGRVTLDWERQLEPNPAFDPSILGMFADPVPALAAQGITTSINQVLAARNQVLFSQTERVQHLASLRLEWLALHEALSISAIAVANFSTKEWLLYPKVGYQVSDGMSATIGAEIYQGPADTLFGLIDRELSSGYAELRFSY